MLIVRVVKPEQALRSNANGRMANTHSPVHGAPILLVLLMPPRTTEETKLNLTPAVRTPFASHDGDFHSSPLLVVPPQSNMFPRGTWEVGVAPLLPVPSPNHRATANQNLVDSPRLLWVRLCLSLNGTLWFPFVTLSNRTSKRDNPTSAGRCQSRLGIVCEGKTEWRAMTCLTPTRQSLIVAWGTGVALCPMCFETPTCCVLLSYFSDEPAENGFT